MTGPRKTVKEQLDRARQAYLEELVDWKNETIKLRNALKAFVNLVEDDKILVKAEHREELMLVLRMANEALQ